MKTTTIKVPRIHVRIGPRPADPGRTAADLANRVVAHVERRATRALPADAARQLQGQLARALTRRSGR
jgi:hypothetical protein